MCIFFQGTVLPGTSDITKELFKARSSLFPFLWVPKHGIPDSFMSLLCQRRLPVNKITETGFWSSSPSVDACQLRVRGPMCMVMEEHNYSLKQPFCVSFLPIWGPCVIHSHLTAAMFPTSHFIAWMLASNCTLRFLLCTHRVVVETRWP